MKKLIILFLAGFNLYLNAIGFVPYQEEFKEIKTKRFRILYPANEVEMAEKTAIYAEDIYDKVEGFMKWKPFGRVVIIITDHTDSANGLAYTHYRNTIQIYTPSIETINGLRDVRDPLYSILLHEMTHIFHLDQISGAAFFWRIVSGRLYFPVTGAFSWFHEGAAVYSESRLDKGGRLDTAYCKALIEELSYNEEIPDFHRLVQPVVDWPFGESYYYLGAVFTEYLINTYGQDKYNQFNKDLSNDFWPFIYEFMIKFRKIYGKSLNNLWNEWRLYEYSKVDGNSTKSTPIIKTGGEAGFWGFNKGDLYYSSFVNGKGSGLYKYDSEEGDKKIFSGFIDDIAFTDKGFLFLQTNAYPGDKAYSDIFFLPEGTKIPFRLSYKLRANLITYSPSINSGVYLKDNNFFVFTLNKNKIEVLKEIKQNDFSTIIDITQKDNMIAFSGRLKTGENYKIGLLNIDTESLNVIDGITGKKPVFIDKDSFVFTGKMKDRVDLAIIYNIMEETHSVIQYDGGYIEDCIVNDGFLYYKSLAGMGKAIFKSEIKHQIESAPLSSDDWFYYEPIEVKKDADLKSKIYNPFVHFAPLYWYPLPRILTSEFILPILDGIPLNYIAPAFTFGGFEPLGRFTYDVTVALDYTRWYPETDVNLLFKLPCLNIGYSFNTFRTNGDYYGNYPIGFFNFLYFMPYFTFDNYNTFSFQVSGGVENIQNQYYISQFSNFIQYSAGVSFSHIRKVNGAYRWNSGFTANVDISGYGEVDAIYDLSIKIDVLTKIPVGIHNFYINNKLGCDLLNRDSFFIGSENLKFNNTGFFNVMNKVDFKGLSYLFNGALIAQSFIYTGTGFDFTLYKRTHYWQFLTLGFRGLYLKTFNEFIVAFNYDTKYMVDAGLELSVDFFAYYGNVSISFNQGYSVGYLVGNKNPQFNLYLYANIGL